MERLWHEARLPLPHLRLSGDKNGPATVLLTCSADGVGTDLGYRDDGRAASPADRRRLAAALGIAPEQLVFMEQVHGAGVARVTPGQAGAGLDDRASAITKADATVSASPGIALVGLSADCPLVALWEPAAGLFGMVHAGWRGLAQDVLAAATQLMADLGADAADILAAVGPAARGCCYEVGPDVVRALAQSRLGPGANVRTQNGRTTADLTAVVLHQLAELGIPDASVVTCDACTVCSERFHSYRRDGARAGRQALAILLEE